MKRLVPVLVLVAFWLALADGSLGRPQVKFPIRACPQACPNYSPYLPADPVFDQGDVAPEPAAPQSNLVFLLEPSQEALPAGYWLNPSSPKHYCWLGQGSGALPF